MPQNYQFIDNETGEAVGLNTIDELMCAEQGLEPHPKLYCTLFLELETASMDAGSDGMNEKKMDGRFEQRRTCLKEAKAAGDESGAEYYQGILDHEAILRKFAYERFTLIGWRSMR